MQRGEGLAPLAVMGAQLRATLKPRGYHGTMVPRDLREALNWAPILPRDSFLAGVWCNFFPVLLRVIIIICVIYIYVKVCSTDREMYLFLNLVKSNYTSIAIPFFRLILDQTEF